MEDIGVMKYQRLKNLVVLVTATANFAATFLGQRMKLLIHTEKLLVISQRFFGIPPLPFYALADGTRVFSRAAHSSRYRKRPRKRNSNAPSSSAESPSTLALDRFGLLMEGLYSSQSHASFSAYWRVHPAHLRPDASGRPSDGRACGKPRIQARPPNGRRISDDSGYCSGRLGGLQNLVLGA
jgi:hypothetical protein